MKKLISALNFKTPGEPRDKRIFESPPNFLFLSEVDDGHLVANHIFLRKYKTSPPTIPKHFIAFYKRDDTSLVPICYLHLMRYKSVYLVGGACTDGRAFELMHETHRSHLKMSPGVFFYLLRYAFDKLENSCEAFFGYCGDARALEVDLMAGFEQTEEKYILLYAPNGLSKHRRKLLMNKIVKLGPF